MWLKADLHIHAHPSDRGQPDLAPADLAEAALQQGLDLVAVTDHDSVDFIEGVGAACAEVGVAVIPGIEVTTSRGHLLCYAPSTDGVQHLRSLMARGGIAPEEEPDCDQLQNIIETAKCPETGRAFRHCIITVAAHAEKDRSLLSGEDSSTSADQLRRVARLDAIEVTDAARADQWEAQGVKSTGLMKPILLGSDAHSLEAIGSRHTWIYLHGGVSTEALRQALASPEVSLFRGADHPTEPSFYLTRISVQGDGGLHDGLDINLHPRLNAIIGAPSVGKSLIVDILREAFDDECPIDEIASLTRNRVAATLPSGSTITVNAVVDGEPVVFRREVGGVAALAGGQRPIIFSQGELTRRAMAEQPELELIDMHSDTLVRAFSDHEAARGVLETRVQLACDLAKSIRSLNLTLDNPVDGLTAVDHKLENLGPAKGAANSVQRLRTAESWREEALKLLAPHLDFALEPPQVPAPPVSLVEGGDVLNWTDLDSVNRLIEDFRGDLTALSAAYKARATELLGPNDDLSAALSNAEQALDAALLEGNEQADDEYSAVLDRVKELQAHKVTLDKQEAERQRLTAERNEALAAVAESLSDLAEASADILEARKQACRDVNEQVRGFFCHVTDDDHQQRLDSLKSLKTGLREQTLRAYCSAFDPLVLIQDVIQNIVEGGNDEPEEGTTHSRCVEKIVATEDWRVLVELLSSRTHEQLHIEQKQGGSDSVPFERMTEGTRALAIKEISFAASDRPVISDQPEDSVPTRAVYSDLVPTLREQRSSRQFIVVSHDANIVVGADADQVVVLSGGEPLLGNLHEEAISREALENLEGGREAFELRTKRYKGWVTPEPGREGPS